MRCSFTKTAGVEAPRARDALNDRVAAFCRMWETDWRLLKPWKTAPQATRVLVLRGVIPLPRISSLVERPVCVLGVLELARRACSACD